MTDVESSDRSRKKFSKIQRDPWLRVMIQALRQMSSGGGGGVANSRNKNDVILEHTTKKLFNICYICTIFEQLCFIRN